MAWDFLFTESFNFLFLGVENGENVARDTLKKVLNFHKS